MTVAQSEDTCVVGGMPRAAISKGFASKVVPLDALASFLVTNYHVERSHSDKNEKHGRNERTPVSSTRT
jgi:chemotaxis response regulator CheB